MGCDAFDYKYKHIGDRDEARQNETVTRPRGLVAGIIARAWVHGSFQYGVVLVVLGCVSHKPLRILNPVWFILKNTDFFLKPWTFWRRFEYGSAMEKLEWYININYDCGSFLNAKIKLEINISEYRSSYKGWQPQKVDFWAQTGISFRNPKRFWPLI